jgi:RNA polymerase sigma-70 factor (ECF subfamily)
MERAAFVLRHFEGRSIDDISRTLGLKTNATKHSIFRAVRKMRAALEPFIAAGDRGAGDEEAAATPGSL